MRMPGNLNFLSRAQGTENLISTPGCERFQLQQLLADIDLRISCQLTDLLDLLFELHQRLLKIKQWAACH